MAKRQGMLEVMDRKQSGTILSMIFPLHYSLVNLDTKEASRELRELWKADNIYWRVEQAGFADARHWS